MIAGRTFLVTGANSGIGRALVESVAAQGACVVLAARSAERTQPVLDGIRSRHPGVDASFLPVDLADLTSIRRAAAAFLSTGHSLDVVVNNAGVLGARGLSPDGFNINYATNYIGPFLLTNLLLPALRESVSGRIVNVSSTTHTRVRRMDWSGLDRRTKPMRGQVSDYPIAKLMSVMHAVELARRLADTRIGVCALHPGGTGSSIYRSVPQPFRWLILRSALPNEAGAEAVLRAATTSEVTPGSIRYYDRLTEHAPSALAMDADLARELWERTEAATTASAWRGGTDE